MQELNQEMTVVRAQLAHVAGCMGDVQSALEQYSALTTSQLDSDVATAALTANNVAALRVANYKGGGDAACQKLANVCPVDTAVF